MIDRRELLRGGLAGALAAVTAPLARLLGSPPTATLPVDLAHGRPVGQHIEYTVYDDAETEPASVLDLAYLEQIRAKLLSIDPVIRLWRAPDGNEYYLFFR